jgi:hypothetical protein
VLPELGSDPEADARTPSGDEGDLAVEDIRAEGGDELRGLALDNVVGERETMKVEGERRASGYFGAAAITG